MGQAGITRRVRDGLLILQLTGELSGDEVDAFPSAPWTEVEPEHRTVLFDMTRLTYVNSAGIALLIRWVRETRRHGMRTYAFGVSPHYQKIFRIVGLTSYMELFPDEYSAVEIVHARHANADTQGGPAAEA
ncbi:STAS domain-containing protein [Alicyclobacillus sp.]|uniref:STAS domain-containing protein n=1 Tax=Alicyclobacillus sp. TaxID=61169 RepID=UPI0025BFBC5E|nr:STAS domain-containing protein [Alicyclobacillus sp.]MCL6517857.1 STAS domain-containing protein [Alicyclobacillus sp.]